MAASNGTEQRNPLRNISDVLRLHLSGRSRWIEGQAD